MSKNNSAVLFGSFVGLTVAVAMLLFLDKDLRDESLKQARGVLQGTKKLVNHYRGAADFVSRSDSQDRFIERQEKKNDFVWKNTIN